MESHSGSQNNECRPGGSCCRDAARMPASALQAERCASTVTSSIVMMVRGVAHSAAVNHSSERLC